MRVRFLLSMLCVAAVLGAGVAQAADPPPRIPSKIPEKIPQRKVPPPRTSRKPMLWKIPKMIYTCGNKVPGFGLLAGYTVSWASTGKPLGNGVQCTANQVCAEPVPGKALCAGPGNPKFSQRCYNSSTIQFAYSDMLGHVDNWLYECSPKSLQCVAPPDELAHCVPAGDVQLSCANPNTLSYNHKGKVWAEACPTDYPYCYNGKCGALPPCVDQDDPENDDVGMQESTKDVTLPDGTKKSVPIMITTLAKGSAITASTVAVLETTYTDTCKDQYGPILMEQVCAKTKLINFLTKEVTWASKPTTQPYDCQGLGAGYLCFNGACVDPDDPTTCIEGLDPECTDPDNPEFDCDAPLTVVESIFPDATVEGKPGAWHVSICSTPQEVFKNSWVTHLICFKKPGDAKSSIVEDAVPCAEKGTCAKGLCSGKKVPFCTANNEAGKLNLLVPGKAQVGIGTAVTNTQLSQCTGFKTIKYPLCESTTAGTIIWENAECAPGYFCVKSPDGASCRPITDCFDGVGEITIQSTDIEVVKKDACEGEKSPGTQGTKKLFKWECVIGEKIIDVKTQSTPCPGGTACCVVGGGAPVCTANCPPDPPPPEPITMSYTCTDDDPANLSQQPGTVTIDGAALFNAGVVSHQKKTDECIGLYDIRQFACKAASAVGSFGEGFGKLLQDLGKQSCTQALIADGVVLTPEQIGVCKVDPATNAGVCELFTPTPTEPTPDTPPSLACADDDPFNDITLSGAVVITKPDQSYKSKEDFCVGDYGVIQYECAVDAAGDPIWKEVGEEGVPALCPNGCAQGRCCSSGSFEYSPGLFKCFEDVFDGTPI